MTLQLWCIGFSHLNYLGDPEFKPHFWQNSFCPVHLIGWRILKKNNDALTRVSLKMIVITLDCIVKCCPSAFWNMDRILLTAIECIVVKISEFVTRKKWTSGLFPFSEQIFEGYFTSVEGFYWTYGTLSSDCYWFEKYLWWRLAPAPPCLNGPVETHSSEISAIVSEWCKFHSVYIVGTA